MVRSIYHDVQNEAIYTGSEDGILCGWSLASLPRLIVGDPEVDDDGGDGREDVVSDDEADEESEIESDSGSDSKPSSEMDVDEDREEQGPRYGPILGRGSRDRDCKRNKRREKRLHPY